MSPIKGLPSDNMKILFITQGRSAEMFYDIGRIVEKKHGFAPSVFVGSDKRWFEDYLQRNPDIGSRVFLGEWEIAARARNAEVDRDILARFEDKYGVSLWRAAVCDRRLITGWKSGFVQDYKPRLTEEEILKRLQTACLKIEELFDREAPTHAAGFICVTYVEFIAYMEAKSRGLPVANIRPMRIKNYMTFDSGIYNPPRALIEKYNDPGYRPSEQVLDEAGQYMQSLKGKPMLYEGAVMVGKSREADKPDFEPAPAAPAKGRVAKLAALLREIGKPRDTHSPSTLPAVINRFKAPFRVRRLNAYLEKRYVPVNRLDDLEYVFFPLHLEPEMALLLFAPAYQNQVEVARVMAQGMPAGMKLVIKDHPLAYGRRSLRYYQKLLEIPGVMLADPLLPAKALVDKCRMVALIGGSVGIEAMIRKKPVLALGPCAPYRVLGDTKMLVNVTDLNSISRSFLDLLENYEYDEAALLRFLAATIDISYPLNLYSALLGKKGVYAPGAGAYEQEAALAAQYLMHSFGNREENQ